MTGSPNRRAYPRLEPDEGKLSCPVLRGGSASNDALLPNYDQLYQDGKREIVEVACWAHSRRKFFEAQSSDLVRTKVMLAYVRLLYDVEREARKQKLCGEARRALRQAQSKPILNDIRAYLEREQPQVLPKSPEGQAIAYTLSNWKALTRYAEDGDLEIDNNGAHAACGVRHGMPTSGLCRAISPPMPSERESAALIVAEAA